MQLTAGDTLAALSAYRGAWSRFQKPADRARAQASIAGLRAAAVSDALRARLAADSVRYAHPDSARAGPR